jgi:hypothetical protein
MVTGDAASGELVVGPGDVGAGELRREECVRDGQPAFETGWP